MRAFKTLCCMIATCMAFAVCAQQNENVPPVRHSRIGDVAKSADGSITLKVVGQKLNYGGVKPELCDTDVWSPKSVHFHPNGKKYYINSLEGCRTMVYDARTNKKLAVIHHKFTPANAYLWAKESGFFPFHHYTNKKNLNTFWGRPVESTFSHRGRYLWIPYYRRSYDINAQDPSAISVIDTRTDSIIKVFETGPLPKMVATTHSGKYLAVTHWGDNTVGLIDITDPRPQMWRQRANVVIDRKLNLDFPLDSKVDRDNGSGNALRGTVFTPQGRYALVACMGGMGGIAVVDVHRGCFIGRLTGMLPNIRHLVVANDCLYLSANRAGAVQRVPMSKVMDAIARLCGPKDKNGKRPRSVALNAHDIKTLRLTGGIRTIAVTADGRYLLAASNTANCLHLVDARTLRKMLTIPADSYPVGLDVSSDGSVVVSTSQGRDHRGGNAVDVYTLKLPTR